VLYNIEMARELSDLGFVLLRGEDDGQEHNLRVVRQTHSVWKHSWTPQIVLFDEAELTCNVFTDGLNARFREQNHAMIELCVRFADLVISMDATLRSETMGVIGNMDPQGKWFVQTNTKQTNLGAVINNHATSNSIEARCARDVRAGKVVSIASGSREKLDAFRQAVFARLPEDLNPRYRVYNSKTPGRETDFEQGLDDTLGTDFDMLMHTGTMGVGVQYSLGNHVDKRYLLVNYNEIPAHQYLQFLDCLRYPEWVPNSAAGKPRSGKVALMKPSSSR